MSESIDVGHHETTSAAAGPELRRTDVLLVGAGPIGLEMAVALQEASCDFVHVEARQVGHTISWFPRQARFFSSPDRIAIAGVPLLTPDQSKATREEYLSYLWSIVQQFGLSIQAYERVTAISHQGSGFRVTTEHRRGTQQYEVQKIILAIGDMHRPRPLQQPGLGSVPGSHASHVHPYFEEPQPYVGQRLLIVGGRNSAVEAAVRCHRAGAKVAISYRQAAFDDSIKYWLKPEIEWLVKTGAIQFFPRSVPVQIEPGSVTLAPVDDQGNVDLRPDRSWRQAADFVLPLIGYQMDTSLLEMAGVELIPPQNQPVVDPQTQQTKVPGIYIAGTASAGTQHRYRLFIENCHAHVVRIARHLTGRDPQHVNPLAYVGLTEQPES